MSQRKEGQNCPHLRKITLTEWGQAPALLWREPQKQDFVQVALQSKDFLPTEEWPLTWENLIKNTFWLYSLQLFNITHCQKYFCFSVLGHRAPKYKTKNSMDMTHRFFSVTTGELLEVSAWPLLNSVCGLLLWSMGAPQNGQKTNKKTDKKLRDLWLGSEAGLGFSAYPYSTAPLSLPSCCSTAFVYTHHQDWPALWSQPANSVK